jgi:hypothetical protein
MNDAKKGTLRNDDFDVMDCVNRQIFRAESNE